MIQDWKEAFREAITLALATEYGDSNPRWSLESCSAEEAARTATDGLQNVLERFRMEALYRGTIIGAEAARERVREAYEDGHTEPEHIIRVAGPVEGRKKR